MSGKPNFLFIITDQQRKDHLSCYNENSILKTPHIDSIAKEGIKFTRFYCNNPICMPNRSTIFTGKYPSVHRVTTNGRNLPQGTQTFTEILNNSGDYHTASFGKIHLNYFGQNYRGKFDSPKISNEFVLPKDYKKIPNYTPYFGLEESKIISGHGTLLGHPDYFEWMKKKLKTDEELQIKLGIKPEASEKDIEKKIRRLFHIKVKESFIELQVWKHKLPEELYSTTFVKDNVIKFLDRFSNGNYDKNRFFTICSFPDPHAPFTPPGKYYNMFNPEDVELPDTFDNDHKSHPDFIQEHYQHSKKTEGTNDKDFPSAKDLSAEEAKRVIAASYGMEKMIDDAVGEILKALEDLGLRENTIVIYTTDHGELGGEHRLFFKGPFLYQPLINIPFIISVPGGIRNKISDSLASSIDIPETILELAGFEIPRYMQGKSLLPILEKPDEKIKKSILIEMDDNYNDQKTRTIVTQNWRLTFYKDFGELYNLKKDPKELNNLWDENKYQEIKLELILKLLRKIAYEAEIPVLRDCDY
ncbi:MAG: sulfatase-like hydrolase/transferase [Candidatus Lokiarchaeota archaeon]|nr:sulfatase-like hydrolase/transferase [Candidatus Lokiarchaeota archaeon]